LSIYEKRKELPSLELAIAKVLKDLKVSAAKKK